MMNPIAGELTFEEAWTRWLDAALEDPELTPHLSMAFALGLTPNQLRGVAARFHSEYDQSVEVVFDDMPLVEPLVLRELTGAAPELKPGPLVHKWGAVAASHGLRAPV